MLTIFSLPKSFTGIFKTIQENAIQSWMQLEPKPEIILFGDDEGTADAAKKFKLRHIPDIIRNQAGTPIVSDIFTQATQNSSFERLCFVNSDIILDINLFEKIKKIDRSLSELQKEKTKATNQNVIISKRWNLKIEKALNFKDKNWNQKIKKLAYEKGSIADISALDIFIFPKNLYSGMPPFSIGWPGAAYDNWMIWYAKSQKIPVIDITNTITIIHQDHPTKKPESLPPLKAAEREINLRLAGGYGYCYDILDVKYLADSNCKLKSNPLPKNHLFRQSKRFVQRIRDYFRY